ncbi:hypothetical protein ED733_004756 [Metarhizium rileyi]|uniref:Uncharacterized protein n=1 Tax=Metarhizium rileyi (strain RCEF 4871) TaxID=1649241 RepID=A0A5C6GIV8_METRR|nr:hypothetical protein ED733_004756 [Metarhizium rileyi]
MNDQDEKQSASLSPPVASSNVSKAANVSSGTENKTAGEIDIDARNEGSSSMNAASKKGPSQKLYNAAGDTTMIFGGDAKQGLLWVRATPVSRVKAVLPGKLLLPAHMYESMVLKLGNVYITGEPIVEAFWRTLIANRTMFGEPAPPGFALQYENMKKHDQLLFTKAALLLALGCFLTLPLVVIGIRGLPVIVQVPILSGLAYMQYLAVKPAIVFVILLPVFRRINIFLLVPVLLALAYYVSAYAYPVATLDVLVHMGVTTSGSTMGLPADCAAYASSIGLVANKHALCFTEDRLIGLMPLTTQTGDIVVIIHGCDVPFVIRPSKREGHYCLVGECYVHGVMNGEMIFDVVKNSLDITLM